MINQRRIENLIMNHIDFSDDVEWFEHSFGKFHKRNHYDCDIACELKIKMGRVPSIEKFDEDNYKEDEMFCLNNFIYHCKIIFKFHLRYDHILELIDYDIINEQITDLKLYPEINSQTNPDNQNKTVFSILKYADSHAEKKDTKLLIPDAHKRFKITRFDCDL